MNATAGLIFLTVAALDELASAGRAGDVARARALLPTVGDGSTEAVLLDSHLLLLERCDTK